MGFNSGFKGLSICEIIQPIFYMPLWNAQGYVYLYIDRERERERQRADTSATVKIWERGRELSKSSPL